MAVSNPYVIPMSWRNILLVIGSGLALWVLPWLAWPSGHAAKGNEPLRKPPVFRYVKGVKGLDGSTWSPVLMPMPTSDGFSKKAAVSEIPGKKPVSVLKPRDSEPPFLDMKSPAISPMVMPTMASLGVNELNAEGSSPAVLGSPRTVWMEGLQMEVSAELKERQFSAPLLKTIPLNATEFAALSFTAHVELDRRGFVQHLLLEQSSGVPSIDALVVRSLRAGTGTLGHGLASGLVKVYYWNTGGSGKE